MQKAERHGGPTRLGSYDIVRPLARGGMAELFLARVAGPQTFEKLVVVKKILPKFADNPRFLQLFNDEAKLAQSLSHKNIVAVHDVGGTGSDTFFAMEYLHGQDVRSILHRSWKVDEKMPIPHVVLIARSIAQALHYAHEKRRPDGTLLEIVHRDVSPSNVLVSYDGAVKLVDFGVAKAATRTVKTRTGTLKGKIAYMSPEQAKGAAIDRRSDVFSLGIVLWEMITTARLFRGENDLATLQLIINQPIKRPTEERPDCPPELERIVLKALAQDVAKRYQTANEVVQDLEELVRKEQLAQSAGGLATYLSGLFKAELDSWEAAKEQGVALGEHLTNVGELTTPISESDFVEPIDSVDMEEEEEDPEDSLDAVSGTIDPKTPLTIPRGRAPTPAAGVTSKDNTPPPQLRPSGGIPAPVAKQASGPVQRADATPRPTPPPRPSQPAVVATTPARGDSTGNIAPANATRGDATEMVSPLPTPTPEQRGLERGPTSSPWPATPTPHGGLAHGSWPQGAQPVSLGAPGEDHYSPEQAQKLKKQFVWIGGALLGLVLIIAIVTSGGGSSKDDRRDPDGAETLPPPKDDPPAKAAADPPREPDPPSKPAAVPVDAGVAAVPVDAAMVATDPPVKPPVTPTAKKRRPPVKKLPGKKFDPNSPLPPR